MVFPNVSLLLLILQMMAFILLVTHQLMLDLVNFRYHYRHFVLASSLNNLIVIIPPWGHRAYLHWSCSILPVALWFRQLGFKHFLLYFFGFNEFLPVLVFPVRGRKKNLIWSPYLKIKQRRISREPLPKSSGDDEKQTIKKMIWAALPNTCCIQLVFFLIL